MIWRELFSEPLFVTGLLIRIVIILFLTPVAAQMWYWPFLQQSVESLTFDPWQAFLAKSGDANSFPYGYGMWLSFLPIILLTRVLGFPLPLGYFLTLLAFDVVVLYFIRKIRNDATKGVLLLYWCSPIVIFATYWLGLNDIVPVGFLLISLLFLWRKKSFSAGFWSGVAVSAKLSMILSLPIIGLYLFRNRANRSLRKPFLYGLTLAAVLTGIPFVFSPDALNMLIHNPEMQKVYDLKVNFGQHLELYILPAAYLLSVFCVWRIGRMTFDLLLAVLCVTFFLVLLFSPAAPGWFVWVLPFLVLYQLQSGQRAVFLVICFSLLYLLETLLFTPWPIEAHYLQQSFLDNLQRSSLGLVRIQGVLHTLLFILGVILSLRIWRESVAANEFFKISRKPIVIGIAGDSGAGKDSLALALVGLFGDHSVTSLSGDDYHLWDRHKPMWQVMTHLNPRANDLSRFAQDLLALVSGKSITTRHYDHETGLSGRPFCMKSKEVIIASGLHALYLPVIREYYDLSIYLNIDEGLRRFFKVRRDVGKRGQSLQRILDSIERREEDAKSFVRTQMKYADFVLSLCPLHPCTIEDVEYKENLKMKLCVSAKQGLLNEAMVRMLIGICGLHVDLTLDGDAACFTMKIEGDAWAEDIAMIANKLMPKLHELLDLTPQWHDGVMGVMQLIVVAQIYERIKQRVV